jgi:hypothetical protein
MSLMPESRNRINTVYMMCYFGGGTLGSLLGTWAWAKGQWASVCMAGVAFLLIAGAMLQVPDKGR